MINIYLMIGLMHDYNKENMILLFNRHDFQYKYSYKIKVCSNIKRWLKEPLIESYVQSLRNDRLLIYSQIDYKDH